MITGIGALALFAVFFSFLGIFVADLVYGIIPDLLVAISVIATFTYHLSQGQELAVYGAVGGASLLFFLLLFIITKGKGMGFGDVKLAFSMGFFLGFPNIVVALYMAFLTGAGASIILVIWRKIRFIGGTIPFGPFLILSTIVAYFYGKEIFSTFLARFF